jgi:DNA-binding transcriptional LysR family regulator
MQRLVISISIRKLVVELESTPVSATATCGVALNGCGNLIVIWNLRSPVPLLQEAMVLALPHAHMLARHAGANKALPLKALRDETFIVYRRHNGPGLYDAILSACNALGFSPRVGQEAPRIVSTLNLVAAGLGISLVPESLQRMRMDGVVFRRLAGAAQPKAALYLASRRGETSAAVCRFLALVKRPTHNA